MTNEQNYRSTIVGVSTAIGAGLGVTVEILSGDLPVWIGIGAGVGVAIGAVLSARGPAR